MTRRLAGVLVVFIALLAVAAAQAPASFGAAPRLAVFSFAFRPPNISLLSIDPTGDQADDVVLSRGLKSNPVPTLDSVPAWSPDGEALAFEARVGSRRSAQGTRRPQTKIFLVDADGRNLRPVPGTAEGSSPVFSPEGGILAFSKTKERWVPSGRGGEERRYWSSSIWLAEVGGGATRQLTPWRNGLGYEPSSFSPDGETLAATRITGNKVGEAVAISLSGGPVAVLAANGLEPTYSPDGSKIAYLSGHRFSARSHRGGTVSGTLTDLWLMSSDGSDPIRLTSTRWETELGIGWDPSGSRLAFTRIPDPRTESGFLGLGDRIVEMNADGSCEQTVLSRRGTIYLGASWRPGPEHGAGPIAC